MKNKKILTVDDLINFCQSNNFKHFNANEDNVTICVQVPSKIIMSEKGSNYTEGLRPFVAKAYHDKVNLNKSNISKETLQSTLPSALLRPILANIVEDKETGEKDFGSHDFFIQEDQDGNQKTIYKEQPVGVIFGENTIEYDEEADVDRAILHGYLYEEYCQDAIDILERRGSTDCSVELNIKELSYDANKKVLELEDFYVGGLTLLGSSVKPGMAGSNLQLEDFSQTNNSVFSKEKIDTKLIETLEKLSNKLDIITTLSNFNINEETQQNNRKEEIFLEENKEEILENVETEVEMAEETTEEKTTDGETEVIENSDESEDEESETPEVAEDQSEESEVETSEENSEEEIEVTETEACGGGKKKKKKYTVNEDGSVTVTYELSHDDVLYALYKLLLPYEESDNDYYYIIAVYDDHFIYQGWGGNYFGQSYKKDGDNVSFDAERYELFAEFVTASEKSELEAMRSNYSELVKFKADTENAQLHNQREAILTDSKYSVIAEKEVGEDGKETYKNESYAKLVSEMDNYSLADLEKEVKSVFADYITNGGNFALHKEEPKTSVTRKTFASSTKKAPSRYGNLFSK